MKNIYLIIITALALVISSCGKQDTIYKEFVKNGGEITIGDVVFYIGEGGDGVLTMNGGAITLKDTDYGFCF